MSLETASFSDAVLLDRPVVRISYDADLDFLWALVPGEVIDGHLPDEAHPFAFDEDEASAWWYTRGPDGPLIGFGVDYASERDVDAEPADSPLWTGPRFDVPSLALRNASAGEVLLAARRTIRGSTVDVEYFDLAVAAGSRDDWEEAEGWWRCALEAGEMKAHYGLGYTLVELGRPREALGHLMHYSATCPRNAWAWVWRGKAAEAAGETAEAAASYRRALECEAEGSDETDAAELLEQLGESA